MGLLTSAFGSLFSPRNRVLASRYPSAKTAALANAWKTPVTNFFTTPQPFANPLTMYGGNAWLNGETWEMRREYREWSMREPPVKAALKTKCLAVASLDPVFKAEDPKDKLDTAAAEFVSYSLNKAVGGIGGLIESILLMGLVDGYSLHEPVYEEVDPYHKKYAKFWTVKRYAQVDTEYIRFTLDVHRQITAVRPMQGMSGGWNALPPEDFLIFTHHKIFESPFGVSDLRAVVRDCRLIEAAIKLRHLLLANWSGPYLVAKTGDDAIRKMLFRELERARGSGFIVIPEGAEVEVMNLATSSPGVFDAAITFYRENIVTAIQGSYLQLLSSDNQTGNTMVAKSVSELFVWWLALQVCEVVNRQLIPNIVRPNYGNSVGLPTMTLGGINEAEVTAALDRMKKGHELGLTLSKKQARLIGYFEEPDANDPDDELPPPNQHQQGPDPFGGLGALNPPIPSTVDGKTNPNIDPSVKPIPAVGDNPFDFAEKVKWSAYTNPDDGRAGYISPSGQVRYDLSPEDVAEAHRGARHKQAAQTKPRSQEAQAAHDADVSAMAGPGVTPEVAAEVSSRYTRAKEALYGFMYNRVNPAIEAVGEALKAVGDEPDDFKKMGYNSSLAQSGSGGILDPVKNATGISTHLAATIATKVLSKAFVWLKNRKKPTTMADPAGDIFDQAAPFFAQLYDMANEAAGLTDAPKHDPQAVAVALREAASSAPSGGAATATFRR